MGSIAKYFYERSHDEELIDQRKQLLKVKEDVTDLESDLKRVNSAIAKQTLQLELARQKGNKKIIEEKIQSLKNLMKC